MTPHPPHRSDPIPLRDGSRYGNVEPAPACPVCARPRASRRARYCSDACKQHAYRLRQVRDTAPIGTRGDGLLQPRGELARPVYECSACGQRFLGERRCDDCNRFCRRLGPGGECPHCEAPVLLAELLGKEVPAL